MFLNENLSFSTDLIQLVQANPVIAVALWVNVFKLTDTEGNVIEICEDV
jgi:hypothetical protein